MYKKKIMTCITILLLVAAAAGIFCYVSYLNHDISGDKGTFVKAFQQKVNEMTL